ncbi:hypothetical protein [Pseudobacillus badius]|uniref:hypothetical protein n=1 Tax=Bacillus badius TaxID=1455 RepID=UPI000AAC93B1|nr:hypothetical protein [Bacillus badius]TDV99667.1 hypothetical protein B0G66_12127 [Bacillus badius]UAT32965.1 hypothetical protein K7T73_20200 [Bacillus badius]
MGEHKGAITLSLVVIVLFGVFIAFATGVIDPLMDKIGVAFSKLVDNVFAGSGMPK